MLPSDVGHALKWLAKLVKDYMQLGFAVGGFAWQGLLSHCPFGVGLM
jgi:hypothetical protein